MPAVHSSHVMRLPRMPGLDGLRGLAVALVIVFHLQLGVFSAGFFGVDIFFVVSGFIITALLVREFETTQTIDFKGFFIRRAHRLVPPLLGVVLCLSWVVPWIAPKAATQLQTDLPWLVVANYWQIFGTKQSYFDAMNQQPLLQHLWSLAVETQYYAIWPFVVWIVLRWRGRKTVGIVAFAIATLSTALMARGYAQLLAGAEGEADTSVLYLATHTHLMGLLCGSALAAIWSIHALQNIQSPAWLKQWGWLSVSSLVVITLISHEAMSWLYDGGFLFVALLSCACIAASTHPHTWLGQWLQWRGMQWLGSRSYSLYLWHWPIITLWPRSPHAVGMDKAMYALGQILLTAVVAEISYQLTERRFLNKPTHQWTRQQRLIAIGVAVLCIMGVAQLYRHAPSRANATDLTPSIHEPSLNEISAPSQNAGLPYKHLTLIGDSVLLGAEHFLRRHLPHASIDAQVGRQGSESLQRIQYLRQKGNLGDAVFIHLGTNGYLNENKFRHLLQELSDRKIVVVMNIYADRRWSDKNNALITRLSQEFPRVRLLDWHQLSQGNPDYFVRDGIHLSKRGITAFYQALRQTLEIPNEMRLPSEPHLLYAVPEKKMQHPSKKKSNAKTSQSQSANANNEEDLSDDDAPPSAPAPASSTQEESAAATPHPHPSHAPETAPSGRTL